MNVPNKINAVRFHLRSEGIKRVNKICLRQRVEGENHPEVVGVEEAPEEEEEEEGRMRIADHPIITGHHILPPMTILIKKSAAATTLAQHDYQR